MADLRQRNNLEKEHNDPSHPDQNITILTVDQSRNWNQGRTERIAIALDEGEMVLSMLLGARVGVMSGSEFRGIADEESEV